jgi:hypothetical protein
MMKTTSDSSASETRPPLVCRIVRQWCAVSHTTPKHATTCASCRAYFAATDELDAALRRDAARSKARAFAPSATLEQQILRAVRSSASESTRDRSSYSSRMWALGGLCVAAAAVAITLALRPDASQESNARMASAGSAEDAAVILRTVESLSTQLVVSVLPSAGELVVHNPLQEELGSVYSDMRSALDFLALNFLPNTRLETPPEPQRRI